MDNELSTRDFPAGQTAPAAVPRVASEADQCVALKPLIIAALKTVFDPELPVNIFELGLIYDVLVDESGAIDIRMTLTAPGCLAAQFLPRQVKDKATAVPGVTGVKVEVVWDPPWDHDRMSEAAKLELGLF